MQIHDLNTKALTDPAYVAFDDGTDTYKTEFNDVVADAAAAAVADADLTDNTVAFTSGDAASPTAWTAVDVLTSGLPLKTLFNRISTMVKNVRYIWNLLGSSSFSNVASTLSGAIGNTALTTTAQTLSGAIAEHESDISTLNSKFKPVNVSGNSFSFNTNGYTNASWLIIGCSGTVAPYCFLVSTAGGRVVINEIIDLYGLTWTGELSGNTMTITCSSSLTSQVKIIGL